MSGDGVEVQLVRPPDPRVDLQARVENLTAEIGRLLREKAELEAQNYHLQLELDACR